MSTSNGNVIRLEPHDIDAEQAVLGSMLLSAAAAEVCRSTLVAADFYRPAHGLIFAAASAIMRDGGIPDPVTVKHQLETSHGLNLTGGAPYLHDLLAATPSPAMAGHYAQIVRKRSVSRALALAGSRIVQMAEDGAEDAHGLTERALREIEFVRDTGIGDGLTAATIGEFLDTDEGDDYDWVIPGLLERGDRLVVTGIEGAGKSELFRMTAVLAAAGIHPFTLRDMPPACVLLLDCENSARHTRRKIRPLVAQARLQGHEVKDGNLWVECRPQGIDLALDRDVSWLLRQVQVIRPDITFLGPLYRLAPRALNDDSDAAPVIASLNMIRARGSAVVLEAHAGHAQGPGGLRDLRPRGSSAFLGWPEFGYGLRWAEGSTKARRIVEMGSWRGDRDERDWPSMLAAGGVWPWHPHMPPPANGNGSDPRTAPWD